MGLSAQSKVYVNPTHTDATAMTNDVFTGKVFYNNDGKQIGNRTVHLDLEKIQSVYGSDVKSIMINNQMANTDSGYHYYNKSVLFDSDLTILRSTTWGSDMDLLKFYMFSGELIGFRFRDNTVLMPLSGHRMAYEISTKGTGLYDAINILIESGNKIFVEFQNNCDAMEEITIFYK